MLGSFCPFHGYPLGIHVFSSFHLTAERPDYVFTIEIWYVHIADKSRCCETTVGFTNFFLPPLPLTATPVMKGEDLLHIFWLIWAVPFLFSLSALFFFSLAFFFPFTVCKLVTTYFTPSVLLFYFQPYVCFCFSSKAIIDKNYIVLRHVVAFKWNYLKLKYDIVSSGSVLKADMEQL